MTAVDEAGINVIRYRRRDTGRDRGTDIVVHPDLMLTMELALAIAISVRWRSSYFERPGPGPLRPHGPASYRAAESGAQAKSAARLPRVA